MFPDVGSGSLSGFDDTCPFGIADVEFIGIAVGDTTRGEPVIIGVGDGTVAVAAGVFVGFTVTVGVFAGAGVITGDTVGISVGGAVGVGDADGFGVGLADTAGVCVTAGGVAGEGVGSFGGCTSSSKIP